MDSERTSQQHQRRTEAYFALPLSLLGARVKDGVARVVQVVKYKAYALGDASKLVTAVVELAVVGETGAKKLPFLGPVSIMHLAILPRDHDF